MDFSNNAFGLPDSNPTLSTDTVSHARMVQACRFGWSAGPNNTRTSASFTPAPAPVQSPSTSSTYHDSRSKRLTPCRGRLYHQLTCSHRIRTDLVEDCGSNCLEPFGTTSNVPFYCQECVEKEASKIWEARAAQHNALYPPMDQMTKEQYEVWYDEHRKLEAQFARDSKMYELELKANTRPSNICTALEASKEEMDFAAELDSLSLSLMSSRDSPTINQPQVQTRHRVSLPSDVSEQLHWSLTSLAIDRGSCGVEYSAGQPASRLPVVQPISEEQLWRRPPERN